MIKRSRGAVIGALSIAMLAACGGPQPPIAAPGTMPQGPATTGYTTLYSFGRRHVDGEQPKAALINVNGTFYGTAYAGGKYGDGTVFSMSTTGIETTLHSFHNKPDGAHPSAALLAVNGALYGTTEYGGQVSALVEYAGTVFRITRAGRERVLHRFGGYYSRTRYDGANPVASLIDVNGTLYGTTYRGGANQYYGTVFSVTTSGTEKVLHSFDIFEDGGLPAASLLDVDGTLYGTTMSGGMSTDGYGHGTIYSISTTGNESVIHYLQPDEGADPTGAVVRVKSLLYGTTGYDGSANGGTAFSITTSGSLTVLHAFGTGADGACPLAPMLNVNGTLYGTTSLGGAYGKGTIFRMNLEGKEKVLHSFGSGTDGATPLAGLVNVKGTLYGTTSAGGAHGEGTVFAIALK